MAKKLRRLRIDEGSLVDRPANVGARVLLWKADETDDDLAAQVDELQEQIDEIAKANADLTEQLNHEEKVEMTTTLQKMLATEPGAPLDWTKEQIYSELRGFAEGLFPTESEAVAVAKAVALRRGKVLAELHKRARPAPVARAAAPRLSGADEVLREIEQRAVALRARQPALTMEKAIAKIAESTPELYAQYRAELTR